MQAANDLKVHLGWLGRAGVQRRGSLAQSHQSVLDAAAARLLGLRARDVVGFTFLQLLLHLPIVLFLLWALAYTLEYHPPVIP